MEGLSGDKKLRLFNLLLTKHKKGFNVIGPFQQMDFLQGNYKEYDGILGMYHDQGLIPLKY